MIDTTIRGQVDRGTGLLNSELYIGRTVWNRTSYVRAPRTGKRVARPNPQDEWEISPWEISPDESLRIVDDRLWERIKAQQSVVRMAMARDAHGVPPNRAHRAQHLLSSIVVCGKCGSFRDARHPALRLFELSFERHLHQ